MSFETDYRSLVEAGFEWRAFQMAEPAERADRVFELVSARTSAPTLKDLYKALDDVVAQTYRDAASSKSFMQIFQGPMVGKKDKSDPYGDALRALRQKHTYVLQLRYWDGLSTEEMAELRGTSVEQAEVDLAQAELAFLKKAEKRGPVGDVAALLIELKPGELRR
ncbi:MAG: hypothetical protein LBR21_07505 [Propionibacteriaceae bacterium]|nr:hypothetical protein [Propionibacteriaceae bacterium]